MNRPTETAPQIAPPCLAGPAAPLEATGARPPRAAPATSPPAETRGLLPRPILTPAEQLDAVLKAVARRGNHRDLGADRLAASPLGQKIRRKMDRRRELVFILPAFPAKSSNRDKTAGAAPDLGEYLGLRNLDAMCAEIAAVYAPGARVVICSDGRVFNDIVMVSDADLDLYSRRIRKIIEARGLRHLETYSLDDCAGVFDPTRVREELVERFGPTLDEVRAQVRGGEHRRAMFNGIHRFVRDDLGFHFPELSKNQVSVRAKRIAYRVIRRSQSWDNFLETVFPETLRLSIHPYPIEHKKFGVKLVETSDRWATPWHNVVLKRAGSYRLVKRSEALAAGATLRLYDEEFAYYEA